MTNVNPLAIVSAAFSVPLNYRVPLMRDPYLELVAEALNLTFEEVKRRFEAGEEEIRVARAYAKSIMFMRALTK